MLVNKIHPSNYEEDTGMKFGYVRVSTEEQNLARQYEAMARHGVEERFMTSMRVPLNEALAMIDRQEITDAKTVLGLTLAAGRLQS